MLVHYSAMSSLGVPSVVHKPVRAPIDKPGPGDPENINSLARAVRAAVEVRYMTANKSSIVFDLWLSD